MKIMPAAVAVLVGLGVNWLDGATASSAELQRIELNFDVETRSMTDGPLTVTLSMAVRSGDLTPIMTLHDEGRLVLEAEGTPNGYWSPHGNATFVEMDASNPYPEVVFSSHTGGSACCAHLVIATSSKDGETWNAVEWGLPGDLGPLADADGDGLYELVSHDFTFIAFGFDCNACNGAPMVIYSLSQGEIIDVTREPRFQPAHRREVEDMEAYARRHDRLTSIGWLTGWAAQKALVGEGEDAMKQVESVYDQKESPDFPANLRKFLKDTGYLP